MITFDFDDTLTRPVWSEKQQLFEFDDNPNYDSIAKLRGFHDQGEEIRIVTTRWSRLEIVDFVEQYKLPIGAIHCTEGELKGEILDKIGAGLHFDDSPNEALNNQKLGIPTMIVSYRFDPRNNCAICEFNLTPVKLSSLLPTNS
jgi:hypothetical protein